MHIVVPFIGKNSWGFDGSSILFHYQILVNSSVIVYFPTTNGSNILRNVPFDTLEVAITDYVKTQFVPYFDDEKHRVDLQRLFAAMPIFDIHFLGTLNTGKIVIDYRRHHSWRFTHE